MAKPLDPVQLHSVAMLIQPRLQFYIMIIITVSI
jgi:hypothetical protein